MEIEILLNVIALAAFVVVLAFVILLTFGTLDFGLKKTTFSLNTLPKVSIIIPARNEEEVIGNCIDGLKKQDYPRDKLEILVINDESTDKTGEIAQERLLNAGMPGKVINLALSDGTLGLTGRLRAVDAGIRNASNDICIIIDGDSYPEKDKYIRNFVKYTGDPKIGLLSGPTTVVKKKFGSYTLQRAFWFFFKGLCRLIKGHMGGNSCVRKSVYEKVGGYEIGVQVMAFAAIDSKLIANGYKIVNFSNPACRIVKEPVTTRKDLMNMLRRWFKYGIVKQNRKGLFIALGCLGACLGYLGFMSLIQWFLPFPLYTVYLLLILLALSNLLPLIVALMLDWRHCLSGPFVWAPLALGCGLFLQNRKGKSPEVWRGRQLK